MYRRLNQPILAFASSDKVGSIDIFDPDAMIFVMDNSATGHICNDRSLFVGDLSKSLESVETCVGKMRGVQSGTIKITWVDDSGGKHTHHLEDVQFIPSSSVNILSIRRLAEHFGARQTGELDRNRETKIETDYDRSIFTFDHGRFTVTFQIAPSGLPEMCVNEGYNRFRHYCSVVGKYIKNNVT